MLPDLSKIPEEKRAAAAEKIRSLKDFELPDLSYFNRFPCSKHETVSTGCRDCGIELRKHQRVGIAWLYTVKKGLLADSCGTGKTIQAAGLLASIAEVGELNEDHRAVVVVRPPAIMQWNMQLNRMLPSISTIVADGDRQKRINKYVAPWQVLVIGFHMLQRDVNMIEQFSVSTLIVDDVDPLRTATSRTAEVLKYIAAKCSRVAILTGTPLQKRLFELYSVLEPIGGTEVFGSLGAFEQAYINYDRTRMLNPTSGRFFSSRKAVGYKNLDDFKSKMARFALRRTASDIDDVSLPATSVSDVFLELSSAQRQKYDELKRGVLRIIKEQGDQVKRAKAAAAFTYGAQICTGIATLGEADRPGTSCKLDWVEDKLVDGDLSDDKVVVFSIFKNTVRALQARLTAAGVGFETVWGEQPDKNVRWKSQERFWNDDSCRVLIGTTAIEQSLNLQVARHLINIDMILNPARMEQLAGRIRRDGSAYRTIYIHNLLTVGTQEEGYLKALEREQALIDHVWGERSELFKFLSALELLQLIGRGSIDGAVS